MVLGTPEDSNFPDDYFLNTYYHLTLDGMDIRTTKLIERIKESGIKPFSDKISREKVNSDLRARLDLMIYELKDILLNNLNEFDGHPIRIDEFRKYILLKEGWYTPEKWGVWSQLNKSSLVFKLPNNHKGDIKVHFKGQYFNGQEKTAIFVKGRKVADEFLTNAIVHVPEELFDDKVVNIELEHKNLVTHSDVVKSNDNRRIKYGLISLSWSSSSGSGNY
jgi:hypothetical protein